MLYVSPAPVGAVTVILPVATDQVGCVVLTVAAVGVEGCALITPAVGIEIHPCAFSTVTL